MAFAESILARLSVAHILLFLIVCITLKFLYQIVYYHWFHPLAKFPGPFWGGVTRLWQAWHHIRSTDLAVERDLHNKYGSILKLFVDSAKSSS